MALLVGLLVALVVPLRAATADAAPPAVDWARGLVVADGVGVADRHAPSPAVARGTSRRRAEDAARRQLAAAVRALPLAGGGAVGDRAADPAISARLGRAVDQAIPLAAEPQTDGAWRVTMAVPIEAVRQAMVGGPRALRAGEGDRGPPVIVVEGVTARPAVGWTVGGAAVATIWVAAAPAWAADAPRVAARGVAAGDIAAPGVAAGPGTLFVLVARE